MGVSEAALRKVEWETLKRRRENALVLRLLEPFTTPGADRARASSQPSGDTSLTTAVTADDASLTAVTAAAAAAAADASTSTPSTEVADARVVVRAPLCLQDRTLQREQRKRERAEAELQQARADLDEQSCLAQEASQVQRLRYKCKLLEARAQRAQHAADINAAAVSALAAVGCELRTAERLNENFTSRPVGCGGCCNTPRSARATPSLPRSRAPSGWSPSSPALVTEAF